MTETAALQKLLAWLSPAFPVGAFAYSAGLEQAIADGRVASATDLYCWIRGNLAHGAACTDAMLASLAHDAARNGQELCALADLCFALTPARERYEELAITGQAFVAAAAAWPDPVLDRLPKPCPYPIALGALASSHDISKAEMLTAWLTSYVQTQISVAVRLVPLGQTEGLAVLARLETPIADAAKRAHNASSDNLGAIGYAADIATMHHETLKTRIFRS